MGTYQFLLWPMGQDQLKVNTYGAIVDHIEPDEVKGVQVPLPEDELRKAIGLPDIEAIDQEVAYDSREKSKTLLDTALAPPASSAGAA